MDPSKTIEAAQAEKTKQRNHQAVELDRPAGTAAQGDESSSRQGAVSPSQLEPSNEIMKMRAKKILEGSKAQHTLSAPERIALMQNELEGQKVLLQQMIGSNQLLATLLHKVMTHELNINLVTVGPTSIGLIKIPVGMDMREDVLANLSDMLKVPLMVLPAGSSIEECTEEKLRKVGYIKGGLLDASGNPL